jgi:uncharacterized protein (TIGR02391 family)
MSFQNPCGPCTGKGYLGIYSKDICPTCKGLGEVTIEGSPSDYRTCGPCSGKGYLGIYSKDTCVVCKGIGLNLRSSLPKDRQAPEAAFWARLHPEIVRVAKSRFESNHLADAVEAALKEVNDRIKKLCKDATGKEFDGADLMWRSFSPNQPVLLLGDISTAIGKDMQQGYMEIFAGAMIGIRNPKAHANITIDLSRAIHFLYLASLLMFKVDEAKLVK